MGPGMNLTPELFNTSWMALTYREALVLVPMGIMEKSATIMNYDLGGESIEKFGGRASQANLNSHVPRLQQDGRD